MKELSKLDQVEREDEDEEGLSHRARLATTSYQFDLCVREQFSFVYETNVVSRDDRMKEIVVATCEREREMCKQLCVTWLWQTTLQV